MFYLKAIYVLVSYIIFQGIGLWHTPRCFLVMVFEARPRYLEKCLHVEPEVSGRWDLTYGKYHFVQTRSPHLRR